MRESNKENVFIVKDRYGDVENLDEDDDDSSDQTDEDDDAQVK